MHVLAAVTNLRKQYHALIDTLVRNCPARELYERDSLWIATRKVTAVLPPADRVAVRKALQRRVNCAGR